MHAHNSNTASRLCISLPRSDVLRMQLENHQSLALVRGHSQTIYIPLMVIGHVVVRDLLRGARAYAEAAGCSLIVLQKKDCISSWCEPREFSSARPATRPMLCKPQRHS